MNKKLPAIYRSEGTKREVNKEVYYSFLEDRNGKMEVPIEKHLTIEETLDQIFHRRGYSFNVLVHMKLAGREFDTYLVTRTKTTILTLDDETIPIASILDLQIKKP